MEFLPDILVAILTKGTGFWSALSFKEQVGGVFLFISGATNLWFGYQKFESRQSARLSAYLDREYDRLEATRKRAHISMQNGKGRRIRQPFLYTSPELNWVVGRLGTPVAAQHLLSKTLPNLESRTTMARKAQVLAERQNATAYLMQGMLSDKNAGKSKTPDERATLLREALGNFLLAIELDPTDELALEYAGLVELKLGQGSAALEHFEALKTLAQTIGDNNILVRAYSHISTTYSAINPPQPGLAYEAASAGVAAISKSAEPITAGLAKERKADAAMARNYMKMAPKCYIAALTSFFHAGKDGAVDVKRVQEKLLNVSPDMETPDSGGAAAALLAQTPDVPEPTIDHLTDG